MDLTVGLTEFFCNSRKNRSL